MPEKFARSTTVSIAKSRIEIDDLLRRWDCDGIRWTDMFKKNQTVLEFTWGCNSTDYTARFVVDLPTNEILRKRARNAASGKFMESKYQRAKELAGRQEHRVLCLFLKGAFNAIENGLIPAEVIFLPFFVGPDGRTVAEVALPRLPELLASGSETLLGLPSSAGD